MHPPPGRALDAEPVAGPHRLLPPLVIHAIYGRPRTRTPDCEPQPVRVPQRRRRAQPLALAVTSDSVSHPGRLQGAPSPGPSDGVGLRLGHPVDSGQRSSSDPPPARNHRDIRAISHRLPASSRPLRHCATACVYVPHFQPPATYSRMGTISQPCDRARPLAAIALRVGGSNCSQFTQLHMHAIALTTHCSARETAIGRNMQPIFTN